MSPCPDHPGALGAPAVLLTPTRQPPCGGDRYRRSRALGGRATRSRPPTDPPLRSLHRRARCPRRLAPRLRQRLPAYGLLAAAFRPDDQVCVLRSSLRHRQRLLTYGAHHMQPMHKAWHQMHLTRSQVVSDRTGATGMAILQAIIAGERDPLTLAKLRTPPCQHREDEIAKALQGPWRAEPLCALQQAVAWDPFAHQPLTV